MLLFLLVTKIMLRSTKKETMKHPVFPYVDTEQDNQETCNNHKALDKIC